MATIVLRSSCAPLIPGRVEGTARDRDADDVDSRFGAAGADANEGHDAGRRHLDNVASLPVRCDVTLAPRIPVNEAYAADVYASAEADDPDVERRPRPLRAVRLPRQRFLPCGMNNIIAIDRLPDAATRGAGANYLLSLTDCEVDIVDGGVDHFAVVLPVAALPPTFQFSFHGNDAADDDDAEEDSSQPWIGGVAHALGGDAHRMGEIHVSFDHSAAAESYRESVRRKRREREDPEAACTTPTKGIHDHVIGPDIPADPSVGINFTSSSSPWNDAAKQQRPRGPEKSSTDAASIMLALEEESRFIKKALAALGCTSVVFVAALARTLWKWKTPKGKQRRSRRRRAATVDDDVPREIDAINVRDAAAIEEGEEKSVPSQGRLALDTSPLRPPSAAEDEVAAGNPGEIRPNNDGAIHETLHLITPPTPSLQLDAGQDDAVQQDSGRSVRHWYEDFLSPPTNLNESAPKSNDDVSFAANEGDALTSPSSPLDSRSADDPAGCTDDDGEMSEAGITAEKTPARGDVLLGITPPPPRELDFDTPIRSALSPPPCKVSAIQLSRHIESSAISFDEVSGGASQMISQCGSPVRASSVRPEPQANRGYLDEVESADGSDDPGKSIVSQPDEVESCYNVTSPVGIVVDRGSCGGSDQSGVSGSDTATLETLTNAVVIEAIENLSASMSSLSTASLSTVSNDTTEGSSANSGALQTPEHAPDALASHGPNTIEPEASNLSAGMSSLSTATNVTREDSSVNSKSPQTPKCAPEILASQGSNTIEPEASTVLMDDESSPPALSDVAAKVSLAHSEVSLMEEDVESKSICEYASIAPETITQTAGVSSLSAKNEVTALPHGTSALGHQTENLVASKVVGNTADAEGDSLLTLSHVLEEGCASNDEAAPTPEWESTDLDQESAASGQIKAGTWCHEAVDEELESGCDSEPESVSVPEEVSTLADFPRKTRDAPGQIKVDNENHEIVEVEDVESVATGKLNSPPKVEKMPFGFFEELVERVSGKKSPSPNASSSNFSMLAQRVSCADTGKPPSKGNDFASLLAKRAAEVETTRRSSPARASEKNDSATTPTTTPKMKLLARAGQSSKTTPESANTGSSSEFLSDYW